MPHPLHPLTAAEITKASRTFRRGLDSLDPDPYGAVSSSSSRRLRWIEVALEEPSTSADREALLWHDALDPASSAPLRAARVIGT